MIELAWEKELPFEFLQKSNYKSISSNLTNDQTFLLTSGSILMSLCSSSLDSSTIANFESTVEQVIEWNAELLLVGLQNGSLCFIEKESLNPIWSFIVKSDRRILWLQKDSRHLHVILAENTLIVMSIAALEEAIKGYTIELLFDAAYKCTLPVEHVHDAYLLPFGVSIWPNYEMNSLNEDGNGKTKLLLAGTNPMLCIINCPLIEESTKDPLGMATEFLGKKLSGLWSLSRSSPSTSPKPKELINHLPTSFISKEATMIIDDPPRSLINVLWHSEHELMLLDAQYGRCLIFDRLLGLFTRQIKGLRGCELSSSYKKTIIALNTKRKYLDIITIDEKRHRMQLPREEEAEDYYWKIVSGKDATQQHYLFTVLPNRDKALLKMYKLSKFE